MSKYCTLYQTIEKVEGRCITMEPTHDATEESSHRGSNIHTEEAPSNVSLHCLYARVPVQLWTATDTGMA